jgi:hypothetical protein
VGHGNLDVDALDAIQKLQYEIRCKSARLNVWHGAVLLPSLGASMHMHYSMPL